MKILRITTSEDSEARVPEAERAPALDDPFSQLPTRSTCGCHPEGVAFIEPEISSVPCWSDDWRTIGRIGNGTIVDLLDADFAEGGNARNGSLDVRRQPIEIFLKELIFALVRWAVHVAARRAMFIGPKQQPAIFLAHVPG